KRKVDEDVDLPEGAVDLGERPLDRIRVRGVGHDDARALAGGLDAGGGTLEGADVDVDEGNVRAVCGEAGADRRAEATGRAGDDGDAVAQIEQVARLDQRLLLCRAGGRRAVCAGGGPVESRTSRCIRTVSTRGARSGPPRRDVISRLAYCDTCSSGLAMTVRRGRMTEARSLSSKPTTETSSGTLTPSSSRRSSTPAVTVVGTAQTIAVAPPPTICSAISWPICRSTRGYGTMASPAL